MAEIDTTGWAPEEIQYLKDEGQLPDEPAKDKEPEALAEQPKEAETKPEPKEEPEAEADTPEVKAGEGADGAESETEGAETEEDQPRRRETPIDTIRNLRADRRELRREVKELRDFKQQWQERLDGLEKFKQKAEAPDPDLDPGGHARYQEKLKAEQDAKAAEEKKAGQEAQSKQDLYDHTSKQELSFSRDNPDYEGVIREAKELAIDLEAKRLIDLDANEDDAYDQATETVQQLLEAQAAYMKARGLNFAKWAYKNANDLLGQHKKKAEDKPQDDKKERSEKQDSGKKRAEDQLSAIKEGQRAARSPKGGGSTSNLTVDELLGMSDDDFAKHADFKTLQKLMP